MCHFWKLTLKESLVDTWLCADLIIIFLVVFEVHFRSFLLIRRTFHKSMLKKRGLFHLFLFDSFYINSSNTFYGLVTLVANDRVLLAKTLLMKAFIALNAIDKGLVLEIFISAFSVCTFCAIKFTYRARL